MASSAPSTPIKRSAENTKSLLSRMSTEEKNFMKMMFIKQSPQQGRFQRRMWDKETFMRVFPLPGILGERLFETFDLNRSHTIDFDEFLEGYARLVYGSHSDKYAVVYHVYNVSGDPAGISAADLRTMLHCSLMLVAQETGSLPSAPGVGVNGVSDADISQRVDAMVEEAFSTHPMGTRGKLDFDRFVAWAGKHPIIADSICHSQVIMRKLSADVQRRTSLPMAPASPYTPTTPVQRSSASSSHQRSVSLGTQFEFAAAAAAAAAATGGAEGASTSEGDAASAQSQPQPRHSMPPGAAPVVVVAAPRTEKEGYLYKIRGTSQYHRYYVLRDGSMHQMKHPQDRTPKKSVFISGDVVDVSLPPVQAGAKLLPLKIVINHDAAGALVLATESERDRMEWKNAIQEATRNTSVLDNYDVQQNEPLGKGRNSEVCVAVSKRTGERCACKIVLKAGLEEGEKEELLAEAATLRMLSHPFVLRLRAVYDAPHAFYIITELLAGGDLLARMEAREAEKATFGEHETRRIIHMLLEAVDYIHSLGIVHRDIKPGNLMFLSRAADSPVKLVDFGLSKFLRPGEVLTDQCGTVKYFAPEMVRKEPYNWSVDVWAVGITAYRMLCGHFPFDARGDDELLDQIAAGKFNKTSTSFKALSEQASKFLCTLLACNASDRPSAKEALSHAWMQAAPAGPMRAVPSIELSDEETVDESGRDGHMADVPLRRFRPDVRYWDETLVAFLMAFRQSAEAPRRASIHGASRASQQQSEILGHDGVLPASIMFYCTTRCASGSERARLAGAAASKFLAGAEAASEEDVGRRLVNLHSYYCRYRRFVEVKYASAENSQNASPTPSRDAQGKNGPPERRSSDATASEGAEMASVTLLGGTCDSLLRLLLSHRADDISAMTTSALSDVTLNENALRHTLTKLSNAQAAYERYSLRGPLLCVACAVLIAHVGDEALQLLFTRPGLATPVWGMSLRYMLSSLEEWAASRAKAPAFSSSSHGSSLGIAGYRHLSGSNSNLNTLASIDVPEVSLTNETQILLGPAIGCARVLQSDISKLGDAAVAEMCVGIGDARTKRLIEIARLMTGKPPQASAATDAPAAAASTGPTLQRKTSLSMRDRTASSLGLTPLPPPKDLGGWIGHALEACTAPYDPLMGPDAATVGDVRLPRQVVVPALRNSSMSG